MKKLYNKTPYYRIDNKYNGTYHYSDYFKYYASYSYYCNIYITKLIITNAVDINITSVTNSNDFRFQLHLCDFIYHVIKWKINNK